MDRPTCQSCPYCDTKELTCNLKPPIKIPMADFNPPYITVFPDVNEDDFCGKHPDFPAFLEVRKTDERELQQEIDKIRRAEVEH